MNSAKQPYEIYILGPGDQLKIELTNLPEFSGVFTISPDGTLFLPRLRGVKAEGLTIEELRLHLTQRFRSFIREPEVLVSPVGYRPVRVYVGGEVARPGYYTINEGSVFTTEETKPSVPPKLFDALQAAYGVTLFSQLDKVQITRRRPRLKGGGKVKAEVNFLRMIIDGDEDVNIRLYDGDSIFVQKSNDILRNELVAASRTNLSPQFIQVFVTGKVNEPGTQNLPQGASLNQAIFSAGGRKLLSGRVEFLRFKREGKIDRRIFAFNPKEVSGDYRNPILMQGDIIRINNSFVSASTEIFNEITAPVVGLYTVYSIFRND